MCVVNCLVTSILQNIFFCVQQKKETRIGLEQLEGTLFLEIGSFYNSPRVKQLGFTVFECIQMIF